MKKIFIGIIILAIIMTIGMLLYKNTYAVKEVKHRKPIKQTIKEEPIIRTETTASLVAVGDVLIHDSIYRDAFTKGQYDFYKMFKKIKPYIEPADIAIANSESIVGGKKLGLSSYPLFNSPEEVADAISDTGFNVVTMANNHTLDKGELGVHAATNYWNKLGIINVGANQSFDDQDRIRTKVVNGITFSFLSYTSNTNGIPVPEGKEYLVNKLDKVLIEKEVEEAKKISDVVVASVHFGIEYQTKPNEEQVEWAQYLADLGVNIVVGSHPHVLQPPNFVTGKTGNQTYVIYSAGNFISAQLTTEQLTGGIFGITIRKVTEGDNKSISLESPTFRPIYTYYHRFRNYDLIPLKDITNEKLANKDAIYKNTIHHVQTYMGSELKILE